MSSEARNRSLVLWKLRNGDDENKQQDADGVRDDDRNSISNAKKNKEKFENRNEEENRDRKDNVDERDSNEGEEEDDAIKRKGESNVRLNDIILDESYQLPEDSNYLNISFNYLWL